jgi:TRAP transporter TAXI family solute receptor
MRSKLGIVVLLLGYLAAGCGTGNGGGSTQFLSLGTAPAGGAFFTIGSALSAVLNEHKGDHNWDVTAEATKGTQENIRRLTSGEIELALANSAISYFAVRGEEGWDRAQPIRTMLTMGPNIAVFVAPADGGIDTIADLAGKRVVVGPAGAGFEFFLAPLLGAHGVAYDDFTQLHNTYSGAADMLADGSADAAFLGGAVPIPALVQASAGQDLTFVAFDEAKLDEVAEHYPFFRRATIPAGTYKNQSEDFPSIDCGSIHVITSVSVDADLIHELTKTLYDNREAVVARHGAGRAINPNNVVRDTGTAFHPGAIRFYEEIGIWPGD